MTQDFKNMLYLFAANATGCEIRTEGEINISEIYRLSISQGIWTMVYPELAKICDASKYHMSFFKTISQGIARKEFNLEIIKKLEDAGIKCCILKGAAVSRLYKDTECRISGDTDVLIHPKDEGRLIEILKENNFLVQRRKRNDHHTQAMHPVGGLFEAHVEPYSKTAAKILFNGKDMYYEPWSKIEIGGNEYHTLGINDGLMFLTAHYIKHFVNEGGGVRQMMDLLLYMKENNDKIDFDRYNRTLKELKYDGLVDIVKTIGAKYFGFDYEIKNEELAEHVLSDSEVGGIFGFETDERKRFYDAYCNKRTTMSKYKYKVFVSLKGQRSIFNKFFPSVNELVGIYGYSYAKNKLLIPVAWLHRYFDIVFGRRNRVENKKGTAAFKERMQMMQELGMIK